MNLKYSTITGVLTWLVMGVTAYIGLAGREANRPQREFSLLQYFSGPVERVEWRDPTGQLREDDPVFYQSDDESWRQVGHITSVESGAPERLVEVAWYDADVSASDCELVFFRNTGGLDQAVQTMLPPEKREQIRSRIATAIDAHGAELSAAFVPLLQESIQKSLPIIEAELGKATERRRAEIDRLAGRWNEELVARRLIPLARREILPIVREHGEPVAEQIGRELWDRASLWRFGWRAIYDRTPLPQRNLVQEEWDRFVESEAVPVFESHTEQIVRATQRVISDVAANRSVRSEMADVINQMASDEEARELVRDILREALVDNPRVREAWRDVWQSDRAQQAVRLANRRLEPVVRGIGDDLFGTREAGINPNFARVLRNQILAKDRRWLVAQPTAARGGSLKKASIITAADSFMPYPIVHLADVRAATPVSEGEGR